MDRTLITAASIVCALTFGDAGPAVTPGAPAPRPAPAAASEDESSRQAIAAIVMKIRRADYEADRSALAKLRDELTPFVDARGAAPAQTSPALYWRGFALWRRALNGFNDAAPRSELDADLRKAAADFHAALARDPTFIEAQAGEASSLVNTAVLHMKTRESLVMLQQSWRLVAAALAAAPENPRLLWGTRREPVVRARGARRRTAGGDRDLRARPEVRARAERPRDGSA